MSDANERRPRLKNGTAYSEFLRLAAIETDECVLWPYGRMGTGYGEVRFEGRTRKPHIMALELREGRPRPEHLDTCHRPGCPKTCMNYRHLRWDTHSSNMMDRVVDGTHVRGARNRNVMLTEWHVREVRRLHAAGGLKLTKLAREWGVTMESLRSVLRGQSWTWLD